MQLRYFASRSPGRIGAAPARAAPDPDGESPQKGENQPSAPPPPSIAAPDARDAPDPRAILDSIGETVYDWDLPSDRIRWGPNAAALFGLATIDAIASGRLYADCLSHDSESSRHEAIARAASPGDGDGGAFRIRYGFVPPDRPREATIWIEDAGRWFKGPDGRPARAHGLVRIVADPCGQERPLAPHARLDPLTGALNRASLFEQTAHFFARSAKRKENFAALLAAVDNLFALNRTHGYDVADEAIAGLARRLRGNCRERDLVARYAGGKFALVLENCDKAETLAAANRLIEAIAATPFDTSAGPASLSLRIGGVVAPRNGRAAHLLFQYAEEALDLARQPNAPRVVLYEPSAAREEGRMRLRKISDEILAALDEDRIVIALQPLVDAASGLPASYEALVRLRRPDGMLVPPAAILPTAEKSGLIQRIDARVLDLAMQKLDRAPRLQLAVNLSGPSLRDPDFMARLCEKLTARPEIARRLTLEFSETCAMDDVEAATRVIAMLKHCGARVAMDDFGAGHTSFRNLRRFDFDLVKIDGAFVQNLGTSIDDRFFVRTLVDLARHLGLPVVAEWVEDAETAEILRQWGVEYLQGDFFGAAAVRDEDAP
ncbi:bifunctional diguanylate cyclase/phosphodiesterase [uncultured Rhodoblastus sp.]|uniref:bifunctional diguanylate cyclase/phosphodiesterase n=1 Tax=uncultured Rhodoblastus sp. TaxID=543037 RepID=UPI0025F84191|nr:bifunctional diguanylate cyclase/phosphodiesterase [uncultured Rhodoblastus sp.]